MYIICADHRVWTLMMLAGILFLLLLTATDGESSERNCSYQEVLMHLNLTKNKELFTMTRPVQNHRQPTEVTLDVLLYAILDVVNSDVCECVFINGDSGKTHMFLCSQREKEQQLVPYIWLDMWWQNDYIKWNPDQFCGITKFTAPAELLWKPDIMIQEMTEADKAPPSPYLVISSDGTVELTNDQVLVSTCKMHVHKFPFDVQSCNLTFKSVLHSVDDIQLSQDKNSSKITEGTRSLMQTQFEWLFVNMTVEKITVTHFNFTQSIMVYTITIRRRSALYIINFMLPVLFFLGLDLASFLISDKGGEKLSFKVTVLLAVTVLQLILNEILPASSNKVPLIAVYCIGIFGLMMLSLLESILMMYLIEKDSAAQDKRETNRDQSLSEDCGDEQVSFRSYLKETTSELLLVGKEGTSSQLMTESCDLEKISRELKDVVKVLILFLNNSKEEEKPGYWTRKTKIINKVFFAFYVTAITLFLIWMFLCWNNQ